MNKSDLETIGMILDNSETFKPIVQKSLSVINSYGPELYGLLQSMNNSMVDLRAEAIKRYVEVHKFTKKEAMLLVMDQWSAFAKSIQNASAKTK